MSRLNQHTIPFLFSLILYLCGFLLFMEWIYPVRAITYTESVAVFILFAVFCFIVSMLHMKWWIGFLIKGFALLFLINGLFIDHAFITRLWFEQVSFEIAYNLELLITQQWYNLTPLFRSFLFLVLIWMMSYLLHYWFVVMKRILLFVLLTFIYLAILDTFTIYNADIAIVRTFIISFIALGVANFMKELDKESLSFSWIKKTPVWVVPLVVTVLISSFIGYAAPKFDPQWPDPVPFIQSTAENAGNEAGSGVQRVGYGEDDSALGGSFVQDYTPVFEADVADEHYWRIETKDVYTGKGWETSTEPVYNRQNGGHISLETFNSEVVETEEQEAIVDFQGNTEIEKLIYPYGLNQVQASGAGVYYDLDDHSEAIHTANADGLSALELYTIAYENPSFDRDRLQADNNSENVPESVEEQYTQLPSSLPDRVEDLAEEITEPHDNRYEKAKAVEQYFGQNGFTYETTDVDVPEEDEDYVDQFLFESKAGYCDNYSTSMVVMLRSQDIPARWVKGFTSGDVIPGQASNVSDSHDVYEVTNANAHSWVEVYFPETGWVPFEPTQGFSNLTEFDANSDEGSGDDQEEETDQTPGTEEQEEDEPEAPELEEEEAETALAENDTDEAAFPVNWWYVSGGLALLALLGVIGYKTRFRWKTYVLNRRFKNKQDVSTYQEAYHHLLKILQHNQMAKEPGQTLREYAADIDRRYSTDEMTKLTTYYEQVLYNNETNEVEMGHLTQLWQNLIKRIMG
ncbi:transglutaminase-like putative cysteine protease [Virgibacillus natechei]|uniref:Transglutaminase-like putative cysteine protease n=1 Tax=Virgibacillus natechei TaxID=1216297 RepID=A0ABS4IJC2_9BACI|nr:transglutaminase domain-containing protein [Virgibacillus natechei]MBP1970446.1 transglutaminase-like putative cysteine protease [Virgibacillus natechei]UZD13903.1 transglutaminaseTgpA domain-containing protein [Virgibacillus natechei]